MSPVWESGIRYGRYRYRYASGRSSESSIVSLASNKQYISVYVECAIDGHYVAEIYKEKLPKASIGKSCIRFKRASDIDLNVLREIVALAARERAADLVG